MTFASWLIATLLLATTGIATLVVVLLALSAVQYGWRWVAARRGAARREARLFALWRATNGAPADSTYLDPHRDGGPVLVAPDEGNWRLPGSHFDEDARAFRRNWIETGRWDV